MKLVLMGTSDWVVPIFDELANNHKIVAVFTKAPASAGRKMILQKSPVHIWADGRGLKVFTDIKEYNFKPDFIVVISYGVILRDNILNSAPCVNVHPSDLPKYRGPSPMITAVLNGDTESAVCLMNVEAGVDSGDVFMREKFEIGINDNNEIIESRVCAIAKNMLIKYLKNPDLYPGVKQVGVPNFCKKIKPADKIIDWNKSAFQIHNQVRAITGRARLSDLLDGVKPENDFDIKIIKTKIINDKLNILVVQPAGKKEMTFKSFLNGQNNKVKEI